MAKKYVPCFCRPAFCKAVILISFFLQGLIAYGENYYVKNGGSDSNSGLSDSRAWEHHPWMSSWTGKAGLKAGDTVFMQRNGEWSAATLSSAFMTIQQSGIKGKHIVTTWYGSSGAKPLIQITGNYPYPVIQGIGKSFITFDHLEIKHYSSSREEFSDHIGIAFGKDGSGNVSHNWVITNCDIHDIPNTGIDGSGDSYDITIGDTTAAFCATASEYSNHIYDCGYAGILMGGHNPATGQSNWKIYYNYINKIDYHSITEQDSYGIAFSSALSSSGWPDHCYARFNRVEDVINWHGIDAHGGTNIYFQDNYVYNCRGAIIAFAASRKGLLTPVLKHCYIERNIIENPGNHPSKYFFGIFLGAENNLHKASDCYVRRNTLFYTSRPSEEGASYGIGIEAVEETIIENNKITNGPLGNCSGAIHIGSRDYPARNIVVRKNFIHDWSWAINLDPGGIEGDITISRNVIYSDNRSIGSSKRQAFSGNIIILNNTILLASGAPYPYIIFFQKNTLPEGSALVIKNNIIGFDSHSFRGKYILTPGSVSGKLDIDHNLYWNCMNIYPFYCDKSLTFSGWTKLGYDISGIRNTNPEFKNFTGKYLQDLDFEIRIESPAINTGDPMDPGTDYSGEKVSGLPDIGAFEFHQ